MTRTLLLLLALSPAALADDSVTMTLDQFLAMYEKARTPDTQAPVAPTPYTRSSLRFVGEVETDEAGNPTAAVFDATIRIDPLRDGWKGVDLISKDVALLSATVGGKPVSVVPQGAWYRMNTDRTEPFDVKLRFAVPVVVREGIPGLAVRLAPGGATTVELTLPDDSPKDVRVGAAHRVVERVRGGKGVVEAALASGDSLSIQWPPKADEVAEAKDARVYAESFTLVGVGDGVLTARTSVAHEILFAGVDQFQFQVPDGMTVLDVRASGMDAWTVNGDGVLTVDLGFAVERSWSVSVDLEKVVGQGDQSLDTPLLTPLGVDRAKGWVGVTAGGGLEIAPGAVANAGPVDVRTLPATLLALTQQPILLGYKFLGDDATVPLDLSQHEEVDVLVTLIDTTEATSAVTIDGRRLTRVVYEVRNHNKQFLRAVLPAGATLWSASVAGRAIQPTKRADGGLLLPLARSANSGTGLASFPVEVVYVETGDALQGGAAFAADLPKVDVPSTAVSWSIYLPEGAKVPKGSKEGSLRAAQYQRYAAAREFVAIDAEYEQVSQAASADLGAGGLGNSAAPVRVELPLEGDVFVFEKLLSVDDERLWVAFDVRGLK
jgi:hypothetical protein